MKYQFICPECGKEKIIEMPMAEYKSDGHKCDCGAELKRDPNTFCKNYKVNCDGFYSPHQSESSK